MRPAVPCALTLALGAALFVPLGPAAAGSGPAPAPSAATTPATVATGTGAATPSVEPRPSAAGGTGAARAGEYVVTYRRGTSFAASETVRGTLGVTAHARFSRVVRGFSATLTETQRRRLAADPRVERVEPNITLTASGTQVDPPWGLDRLDQGSAATALDRRYTYDDTAQGAGTDVYVVDSGIRAGHVEFTGRVQPGRNFAVHTDPGEAVPNNDVSDCAGHGTHVAGTVAGTTSGVAKKARIVPVRVLDCEGSTDLATLLTALEWVEQHHRTGPGAGYEAVANLSLGGPYSAILNDAVAALTEADVAVVVAAGNYGEDLSSLSPASEPSAITVGATDSTDQATSWSNFGAGLDVWAPGVNIVSADIANDTALASKSGTSMAAPHVAGAVAVLRSLHPGDVASPAAGGTTVQERLARLYLHPVKRAAGDTSSPVRLLQAPAAGSLSCTATDGFTADGSGVLRTVVDPNGFTGSGTLTTGSGIGSGWSTGSALWMGNGGDGVVYLITTSGDLRWYRWNAESRGWAAGSGARIGTGWRLGSGLSSVEVSTDGSFYVTTSTGALRIYRHLGRLTGTASWSTWTVGSGWYGPQVLAPNGDGSLYRQYNGVLYWYRHTDPAAGPVRWQGSRVVGSGWRFADLMPAGGGLLYAVGSDGAVRSYRNVGYRTGTPVWDSILTKGRVATALGTALDPTTCR